MATKTYEFSAWAAHSTYTQYQDTGNAKIEDNTYAQTTANMTNNNYSGAAISFDASALPAGAVISNVRFYYRFAAAGSLTAARCNYTIQAVRGGSYTSVYSSNNTTDKQAWEENIDTALLGRADFNTPVRLLFWAQHRSIVQDRHRIFRVYMTVTYTVPASALGIDPPSLSMSVGGGPVQLALTKTPSDTTDAIAWSSSNASVATVTGAGIVSPVGQGAATITAKADSGVTATCAVTVSETVTVTHSPVTNGSISPGAGNYNKGSSETFTFKAGAGHILESVMIGNETVTAFQDPAQYSRQVTLNSSITLGVIAVPVRPIVTQSLSRARISDRPGFELSTAAWSADMGYVQAEIRKTLPGGPTGQGVGELLHSASENVAAGAQKAQDVYYHHLVDDGDYVITVFVKNQYGVWSG
ncbi:MAG: Ig-like domain-containing protein [Oscillospiraceae bacterium]|nr:Ig-like domain-containing protein [Oscillospiraceae bacterium]